MSMRGLANLIKALPNGMLVPRVPRGGISIVFLSDISSQYGWTIGLPSAHELDRWTRRSCPSPSSQDDARTAARARPPDRNPPMHGCPHPPRLATPPHAPPCPHPPQSP